MSIRSICRMLLASAAGAALLGCARVPEQSTGFDADSWTVTVVAILGAVVVVVAAAIWMVRMNRDGDADGGLPPAPSAGDGDSPSEPGSDSW